MISDPNGPVLAPSGYLPFGEAYAQSGLLPRQRFTSQEHDDETGLEYFNARSLLARTGRFNRPDPLFAGAMGNPQGWNRYAYVGNNPMRYADPSGMASAPPCGTIFYDKGAWHENVCPGPTQPWTNVSPMSTVFETGAFWMLDFRFEWGGGGEYQGFGGGGRRQGPGTGGGSGSTGGSTGGGQEKKDPPPVPINMPQDGLQTVARNAEEIRVFRQALGFPAAFDIWYRLVQNKGDWDYKQKNRAFADFGNFNYGVTGKALGLPDWILYLGAGWAQVKSGNGNPAFGNPWIPFDGGTGDDPRDQAWIQSGIAYYNSYLAPGRR